MQAVKEVAQLGLPVVLMIARQRRFDAVGIEQDSRPSSVFSRNKPYFVKDADGPKGNVFQVADGRSYNVECWHKTSCSSYITVHGLVY